jgi:hypothetical protein
MANKVTHYKVWIHVEGLDKDGDQVEGDDHFLPREAGCVVRKAHAEALRDALADAADEHMMALGAKLAAARSRRTGVPK